MLTLKKITRLAYGISDARKNEFKDIELVKVEQDGKDITKHFTLEKDGSRFILNFDNERTQKTTKESLTISFEIKETLAL